MLRLLLLSIIWLTVPLSSAAHTIHVPAQIPQVGDALHLAAPGDTIMVAPGTYDVNLVWPNTPGIKLFSSAGATQTFLDGKDLDQVIGIYSKVDTTTVIRGFTIQHGAAGGS